MIKILVWILKVNYALNATQRNATQRNATQRNATQRNATQRNATQRNATQRNATQRNSTIIFNGKVIVWDSCFVFSVIMPQNNRKPPLFVS
ncbi:TPA: hypothetical protein AABK62_01470 [Neisseria gonorrhoeae]|nr:hypothetical protein BZG33_02745 [Neisseria gonorrhoeae]AZG20980.1 hypothetical protein EGH12_08255 [Neisseria gonorrhoeae]EEZ49702.1 hypothetical protein NGGG_00610 [Neisseria gonorrhoeae PID18]TJW94800.1 hypothetical protein E8M69_01760 [Neisseria gonorrhoeae]